MSGCCVTQQGRMSLIGDVVRVFRDEPEGILWLPPITIGYLHHVTGVRWHLYLAILSFMGARWAIDMVESDLPKKAEEGILPFIKAVFRWVSQIPPVRTWILVFLGLTYLISAGYGLWLLVKRFTHSDLILVGLTVVWGGMLGIVILNLGWQRA